MNPSAFPAEIMSAMAPASTRSSGDVARAESGFSHAWMSAVAERPSAVNEAPDLQPSPLARQVTVVEGNPPPLTAQATFDDEANGEHGPGEFAAAPQPPVVHAAMFVVPPNDVPMNHDDLAREQFSPAVMPTEVSLRPASDAAPDVHRDVTSIEASEPSTGAMTVTVRAPAPLSDSPPADSRRVVGSDAESRPIHSASPPHTEVAGRPVPMTRADDELLTSQPQARDATPSATSTVDTPATTPRTASLMTVPGPPGTGRTEAVQGDDEVHRPVATLAQPTSASMLPNALDRSASATTPASSLEQLIEHVEQLTHRPPPRQLTVTLPEGRVRISIEEGHVRLTALDLPREARAMLDDAVRSLSQRGVDATATSADDRSTTADPHTSSHGRDNQHRHAGEDTQRTDERPQHPATPTAAKRSADSSSTLRL